MASTTNAYTQEHLDRALALRKEGVPTLRIAKDPGVGGASAPTITRWFKIVDSGGQVKFWRDDPIRRLIKVGYSFGELTIEKDMGLLQRRGYRKGDARKWLTRCSCGKSREIWDDNLRRLITNFLREENGEPTVGQENTYHCKQNPIHYMPFKVGDVIGDLEFIGFGEIDDNTTTHNLEVKALCNRCSNWSRENPYLVKGAQINWRIKKLRDGTQDVLSCGCYTANRTHGLTSLDDDGRVSWFFARWNALKQNSKEKGIPFTITIEDLMELGIPETCPVLGIPIELPSGEKNKKNLRTPNSPSIDKFIPELGYVKGNVHIISWQANRLKNDGTPEEWRKIARWCDEQEKLSTEKAANKTAEPS